MAELERDLDMGEIHGTDCIMVEKAKDIVERLRTAFSDVGPRPSLLWEAADEIERLRARCEVYKGQVKCGSDEKGE